MGKIGMLVAVTLVAFAANSVLCRMALGADKIDPFGFTFIRLLSGAVVLFLILRFSSVGGDRLRQSRGSWFGAAMLFLYATAFSYAYVTLSTGTGALILFGVVQLTMMVSGLAAGERLTVIGWFGFTVAFGGLVYLVSPGLTAPSLSGAVLMTIAGVAWGFYSLNGRGSVDPLSDTTFNFIRTLPYVLLLLLLIKLIPSQIGNEFSFIKLIQEPGYYSVQGVLSAISSGALASGVGYAVWYRVLRQLAAVQASVLQLLVPVIASIAGFVLLSEAFTVRLVIASCLVLGGVLAVLLQHKLGSVLR